MRAVVAIRTQGVGADGKTLLAIAMVALAVQQIAVRLIPVAAGWDVIREIIFVLTTITVIVVAVSLRSLLGAWLVAAGILLNVIPILAHGGTMPVAWETVRDSGAFTHIDESMLGEQIPGSKDVLLLRGDIHFESLSDRYFIDPPVYRPNIYSLGDFFIFAGIGFAVFELGAYVMSGRLPLDRWRFRRAAVPA